MPKGVISFDDSRNGFCIIYDYIDVCGTFTRIGKADIIVFSALVIFVLTGLLTPEEAFNGFSNQGMLTIALLFIVAGAVQKHGIIDRIMKKWLNKGKHVKGSMIRFFIPLSLSSAFLNNTPIVVTFTPMIKKNGVKRRGLLLLNF